MLAYAVLAASAWIFSQWTWNRATAMGGSKINEPLITDFLFALAVCGIVWSLKTIL